MACSALAGHSGSVKKHLRVAGLAVVAPMAA